MKNYGTLSSSLIFILDSYKTKY